jgi:hypothetical protein
VVVLLLVEPELVDQLGQVERVTRQAGIDRPPEVVEAKGLQHVFPDEDGLYRYMLRRRGKLDGGLLVELEDEPTDDEDFDADEGALLIRPTRMVDVREPDGERIEEL